MRLGTNALLWLLFLLPGAAAGQSFDHFSTGFRLEGAHAVASCDACHAKGVFQGTPNRCADCHGQNGHINASTQPSEHITTTDRCESCHREFTWSPTVRVDHLEVFGSCASCHDNRRALGQPIDHPPTGNQCESCHGTTTFQIVLRFDHNQALGTCSSCHNGVTATGQHPTHILTTAECDTCHNTVSFSR